MRRWLGPVAVMALVLCNLYLLQHNRRLRVVLQQLTAAPTGASSFRAVQWDSTGAVGEVVRLSPKSSRERLPLLVYAISPDCKYCESNVGAFHDLVAKTGIQEVMILSLRTEGLSYALQTQDYRWPVYSDLDEVALRAYQMGSTPMTMLVNSDGTITHRWRGDYNQQVADQIRAAVQGYGTSAEALN